MTYGVDEIVEAAAAQGQVPGVVAAVARGDATYVTAAGVMAAGGPPMRPDTLFRISSMTKPITAAVVLSLVDDGLLDLNGPVEALLPELVGRRVLRRPDGLLTDTVEAERPVTVRDLLTFTWGFGMQGAMFMAPEPWPIVTAVAERELASFGPPQPDTTPDPDTWIARLGELPLLAQPGERWLYSAGSQVLGVLAARAADAPFEDVMRERVLAPLGMDDTAFYVKNTGRLATAYERRDGELTVSDPPGFSFLDDRGWGYGVSVTEWGYTWDGGLGTSWSNIPDQDLTVVVLTQRAADETGMPAVCEQVRTAMSS